MERSCRNLAVILSTAIVVLTFAAAVCTAAVAAGGGDLPRQWQRWLNEEVFHIISGRERELFLRLENDEQREQFLAKFWEVRDPTPGTERNEYREEHERRLRYADETFGRGSVFRGRLTDRGRMYVTLGPPQNRYDFPNQASLYPTELWFYEAEPRLGLPPYFYLIFFKRFGAGDYVLYNPVIDGPGALMAQGNPLVDKWTALRAIDVNLAQAAYSYLPTGGGFEEGRTNLSSLVLLGRIEQVKEQNADATYAERILAGDERVTTEYTFGTSELASIIVPLADERGRCYIDFAVGFLPEQVNLGQYQKKIYGALKLVTRVGEESGRTVFSDSKDIDFDLSLDDFDSIKTRPFIIERRIPSVPGSYNVSVTVRNEVSKEQFFVAGEVTVPPVRAVAFGAGQIVLAQDLAGLKGADLDLVRPLQFADIKLVANPLNRFSAKNPLILHCPLYLPPERRLEQPAEALVEYSIVDARGEAQVNGTQAIPKQAFSANGIFHLFMRWPLDELAPGNYTAVLKIDSGADDEPLVRRADFAVSAAALQPPIHLGKAEFDPDSPEVLLALARMWQVKGYPDQAEALLAPMAESSNLSIGQRAELAGLYLELERYEEAVKAVEAQLIARPNDVALLRITGLAYFNLDDFSRAAKLLQRLLVQEGESTEVLNLLGRAHLGDGEKEKALAAWERSLELDPGQAEIRKLLDDNR